jgi:hypothetical protein
MGVFNGSGDGPLSEGDSQLVTSLNTEAYTNDPVLFSS